MVVKAVVRLVQTNKEKIVICIKIIFLLRCVENSDIIYTL